MSDPSAMTGGLEPVRCVLCGSWTSRLSYTKFGLDIVRCAECALRFVNPRYPKEVVWQRYSEKYFVDEYLPANGVFDGTVNHQRNLARHGATLALLESELGRTGRLLDIGSGAGLFLAAAAQRSWSGIGVELSSTGVEFARTKLGVDARQGTAESVISLGETFDVVTMFDVIEHLYNPVEVLRLSRSVLKQGGLIMVSTPNYDALSRLVLGEDWAILSPLEHLYYFTAKTLQRAFLAAGYSSSRVYREHDGWGLLETMNPHHTNAPDATRSRAFARLVPRMHRYFRLVQRAGFGDVLLATARV